MLYPIFELISIWQTKILLLNNVVAKIDSQKSKFDFHYVKIQPQVVRNQFPAPKIDSQGSEFDSHRIKIDFQRLKIDSQSPKRTFWLKKLDTQRHKIDPQKLKVNSYGPKYEPEAQNWLQTSNLLPDA